MWLYQVLDVFLFYFHLGVTLFNLLGWVHRRLRPYHLISAGLTLFSWVALGFFWGLGYCPLTDWHWRVRAKMGHDDMPHSYVKYVIDRATGWDVSASLVDFMVPTLFFIALGLSATVSVLERRRPRAPSKSKSIDVE